MDRELARCFIAAAEQLHFAHAAKSLGLPRSVLIASVKKLEGDLGYPLFDYTAETTTLTDAGEALLKKFKIEAAKAAANASSAPAGGKAKASKGKGRAPAVKGAPRAGKRRQSR